MSKVWTFPHVWELSSWLEADEMLREHWLWLLVVTAGWCHSQNIELATHFPPALHGVYAVELEMEKSFSLRVSNGSGMSKFDNKLNFILAAAVIYRVYAHVFKQCTDFKIKPSDNRKQLHSFTKLGASFTCTNAGFHWHFADAPPAPSICNL